MAKSKYTANDAAKDTNVSRSCVKGTWHNANNDAVGTAYQGRSYKKPNAKYDSKRHGPHNKKK